MQDDPIAFAAQAMALALYARGYAITQSDDGVTMLRGPRYPEPMSPWQAMQRELGAELLAVLSSPGFGARAQAAVASMDAAKAAPVCGDGAVAGATLPA